MPSVEFLVLLGHTLTGERGVKGERKHITRISRITKHHIHIRENREPQSEVRGRQYAITKQFFGSGRSRTEEGGLGKWCTRARWAKKVDTYGKES